MTRTRIDREWTVATVLSTAHSAQHFYSSLLPPLIPILTVALSVPLWQLGLLISVYSLVDGFGQAPLGVLSDRYDRRYLLPPGLGLMGAGYVLFGSAPALGRGLPAITAFGEALSGPFLVMVVSMAVVGLGASVVHPTGYPMISANVRPGRKGRALGIWGSASKFGDTLAPVVVALLILVLSWDRILLLVGVVGVGYAVVLALVLRRPEIDTLPPSSSREDSDDAAAETRESPADPRLFVYPMLAVLLFFVTRGVATKGVRTFVPTFVTDVYGYSLTLFGFTLAPESLANFYFSALLLTAALVQLVAGGLTDRYDHRTVLVGLLGLSTLGLLALSYVRLSPLALLLVLLVVGGGIWGSNPARDTLVSDISPEDREGRTFGYLWSFGQMVSAGSPVAIGYIAGVTGIQDSFRYLALATLLAVGAVALLFSPHIYVTRESLRDESVD